MNLLPRRLREVLRHSTGTTPPARVVPDSPAWLTPRAREEARKGTAAADPVIGVTPEGQVLPGAVVDGRFVAASDAAYEDARDAPQESEPYDAPPRPGSAEG